VADGDIEDYSGLLGTHWSAWSEGGPRITLILISADELARALSDARPPLLLDVRWRLGGPPGGEVYAEGHLPGAIFTDLDADLAAPAGSGAGGRHPLPGADAFTAAMRWLGVRPDRPVVVYDDADSTAAARAWWMLCYFGHPSVRVLDGGFRAWAAAGLPVERGELAQAPEFGSFTAEPGHLPLLDADGAMALARDGVLLDARAAGRYRGESEPVDPVAGHIPGAVSAPTADNVNPDGTFRPAGELAARFAALGVRAPAAPNPPAAASWPAPGVGTYCGSGVTAAHEVLALALAGIPAALYAGSWSEWITDPRRPVATGPGPG
jgi:thiosulfate/3-mercaptopyruvate sulfurtransferase